MQEGEYGVRREEGVADEGGEEVYGGYGPADDEAEDEGAEMPSRSARGGLPLGRRKYRPFSCLGLFLGPLLGASLKLFVSYSATVLSVTFGHFLKSCIAERADSGLNLRQRDKVLRRPVLDVWGMGSRYAYHSLPFLTESGSELVLTAGCFARGVGLCLRAGAWAAILTLVVLACAALAFIGDRGLLLLGRFCRPCLFGGLGFSCLSSFALLRQLSSSLKFLVLL